MLQLTLHMSLESPMLEGTILEQSWRLDLDWRPVRFTVFMRYTNLVLWLYFNYSSIAKTYFVKG